MTDKPPLKERLVAAAFAAGWAVVPRVPERLASAAFDWVADEAWRRRGPSVRRLESNLAQVRGSHPGDPAVRILARRGMRSYLRYFHEVFRLPALSGAEVVARMRVTGEERIHEAVAAGRGLVLALPHMGNWDHAGAWLVQRGHRFTTVAERLRPEALYHRYKEFRETLGMEVLPLTGGQGNTFGTLAQRLRAGGVVCLPADRDLTESGVEVDFFGERTRMAAGPALLSIHTGATLLPATMWYEGPYTGLTIHDEIVRPEDGTRAERAAAMTQALAGVFEKAVAEHPQDWHMMQRLWLRDLDR
ncbi:phosphatidylinositol mannoside acyltransferase [Rhizohabitans arisaemae]|uniref:phosphatidylinositol mannoside acyltransferase n=1 Tax=Rhizohabitans arisaemae TaxID=2720610 RepID=UPI0024B0437D|nr:phosphatidylinositol mannoside acyltransferase [Rhizohabitans arisaemae]